MQQNDRIWTKEVGYEGQGLKVGSPPVALQVFPRHAAEPFQEGYWKA